MNYDLLELLRFYEEWIEWATSEEPSEKFGKWQGLCASLDLWLHSEGKSHSYRNVFGEILKARFSHLGLDESYPFGEDEFVSSVYNDTMHLDPNRLAFVREEIVRLS